MEKKLKRAVLSLYAVGGIQIFSLVVAVFWQLRTLKAYAAIPENLKPGGFGADIIMPTLFWSACILGAIYKIAPKLRAKEPWAWAAAAGIFVVSAPGYALPASVIGLISLFDEDVRSHFLDALDIKF